MRSEGEVVGGLSGVSMLILPLQATRRPISDTSGFSTTLHEPENKRAIFLTTAFERYAVKTSNIWLTAN